MTRREGVRLGAEARIDARRVSFHEGCSLLVGRGSVVEAAIDLERDGAVVVVGANT
jgi:hypothetical protein